MMLNVDGGMVLKCWKMTKEKNIDMDKQHLYG